MDDKEIGRRRSVNDWHWKSRLILGLVVAVLAFVYFIYERVST